MIRHMRRGPDLHPAHLQPGETAVSLQLFEMTGQGEHHTRLRHSNLQLLQTREQVRDFKSELRVNKSNFDGLICCHRTE